jgi:hypothetical protein
MPPSVPGDTPQSQLAIWWALYGDVPVGDNPELAGTVKTVLDWAATQKEAGPTVMSNSGFRLIIDWRGDAYFWIYTEAGELNESQRGYQSLF